MNINEQCTSQKPTAINGSTRSLQRCVKNCMLGCTEQLSPVLWLIGMSEFPIPGWLQDSAVAVPYHVQEKLHSCTVETLLLFSVSDIPAS